MRNGLAGLQSEITPRDTIYTGNLYVTAPAGPLAPADEKHSTSEPFGKVYCIPNCASDVAVAPASVEGAAEIQVAELDSGYLFPSGVVVSSDGTSVFVAETFRKVHFAGLNGGTSTWWADHRRCL